MNLSTKIWLATLSIVILAAASVTLVQALRDEPVDTKPTNAFSFTGSDNWRQGPSNDTSMALFNSQNPGQPSPCFASVEHKPGEIDIDAANQEHRDSLNNGDITATSSGSQTLAMQTAGGAQQYELHLAQIDSSADTDIMGGNAMGYLQLSEGYLEILANCNTADQLPAVFPALEAIQTDKS